MPRFYFHLHGRGSRVRDEEGLNLPDAEAAWFQAVRSARDLIAADLSLGCSWDDQAVEIEDERGSEVGQIPLREIANFAL